MKAFGSSKLRRQIVIRSEGAGEPNHSSRCSDHLELLGCPSRGHVGIFCKRGKRLEAHWVGYGAPREDFLHPRFEILGVIYVIVQGVDDDSATWNADRLKALKRLLDVGSHSFVVVRDSNVVKSQPRQLLSDLICDEPCIESLVEVDL